MSTTKTLLTVIIIAADDGTHDFEYNDIEQSILRSKFNEQVKYIIYKYNTLLDLSVSKRLIKNELARVCFEEKYECFPICHKSFYKPQTLIDFLNKIKEPKPEKEHRYIIMTWGHGAGLGFFTTITALPKRFLPVGEAQNKVNFFTEFVNENLEQISLYNANLSFADDDNESAFIGQNENMDILIDQILNAIWNRYDKEAPLDLFDDFKQYIYNNYRSGISIGKFARIIKKSLGKVDILICMNCFLQMLETGFFLRESVDILVGCQKTIPFYGYNNKMLFELLNNDPFASAKNISDNIITYFPVKYFETPYLFKDDHCRITTFDIRACHISSNNLNEYVSILSAIGEIVCLLKHFKKNHPDLFKEIIESVLRPARKRCEDLTLNMVDVIDLTTFFDFAILYAKIIRSSAETQYLIAQLKMIGSLKFSTILAAYSAPNNFDFTDNPINTFFSTKSISIFFPTSNLGHIQEFRRLLISQPEYLSYIRLTKLDFLLSQL